MSSNDPENIILISGAGIAGLSLGLTLHQIGIPFKIFEVAKEIQPLGVGVNIQPNAVRELFELGISETDLDSIGIQTQEWALVGLNGNDIYSELRGRKAGYNWPQYSVHRGELQMLLYRKLLQRAGKQCILTGHDIFKYHNLGNSVQIRFRKQDGSFGTSKGAILVGADGLHSKVRAQMYPLQPEVHWGGAIMWRGTTLSKPVRTGASFIGLGTDKKRVVIYPISKADNSSGLALTNWIAEVTIDLKDGQTFGDWNKKVEIKSFINHFNDWQYDWLNVPALLKAADCAYEFPMIDRDPIPSWIDQRVVLIGDAAHVMYPTGSNGASQAIVDSRELGASFLKNGISTDALNLFDQKLCKPISELVIRNRKAGPFGILKIIDARCGGVFEEISNVVSEEELSEFMLNYKTAAGLAIDKLNKAEPIISKEESVNFLNA